MVKRAENSTNIGLNKCLFFSCNGKFGDWGCRRWFRGLSIIRDRISVILFFFFPLMVLSYGRIIAIGALDNLWMGAGRSQRRKGGASKFLFVSQWAKHTKVTPSVRETGKKTIFSFHILCSRGSKENS